MSKRLEVARPMTQGEHIVKVESTSKTLPKLSRDSGGSESEHALEGPSKGAADTQEGRLRRLHAPAEAKSGPRLALERPLPRITLLLRG